MPKTTSELSLKEARFIDEYLVDGNASRSAEAAGYSKRTSYKVGCEMLKKPRVMAALQAALSQQQVRTLITADDNLRAIEVLAQKAERDGDWGPAIRARELIGKHYRSFADKVEHTGANGAPLAVTVEFIVANPGS